MSSRDERILTGKYIRQMRLSRKMTQTRLGSLINKPPQRICEWESDRNTIKLHVFLEIAQVLDFKNFNKLFNTKSTMTNTKTQESIGDISKKKWPEGKKRRMYPKRK